MPNQEQEKCPPLELSVEDGAKAKEALGGKDKEEPGKTDGDERVS